MSNTKLPGILGVFAVCMLAACSTPSEVTTTDGQTTYTSDAPNTDRDDGFVTYQKNGHEVKVNKSDVKKIEPVD
ncbi:Lipoprotein YgdI/YgdR-like SH3-like domain-containing protein OS=Castellaniella defragrans OX=75697 GN=HNR28_000991 PE=4 SV=1 [Castellaniella defragrans]